MPARVAPGSGVTPHLHPLGGLVDGKRGIGVGWSQREGRSRTARNMHAGRASRRIEDLACRGVCRGLRPAHFVILCFARHGRAALSSTHARQSSPMRFPHPHLLVTQADTHGGMCHSRCNGAAMCSVAGRARSWDNPTTATGTCAGKSVQTLEVVRLCRTMPTRIAPLAHGLRRRLVQTPGQQTQWPKGALAARAPSPLPALMHLAPITLQKRVDFASKIRLAAY